LNIRFTGLAVIVAVLGGLFLTGCSDPAPTAASQSSSDTPPTTTLTSDQEIQVSAEWGALVTFTVNEMKASSNMPRGNGLVKIEHPADKPTLLDPLHISLEGVAGEIDLYENSPGKFVAFYTHKGKGRKSTLLDDQVNQTLRDPDTSYATSPDEAVRRSVEAQTLFNTIGEQVFLG
jgi:hypothetical protein